jgi:hypothetical protein
MQLQRVSAKPTARASTSRKAVVVKAHSGPESIAAKVAAAAVASVALFGQVEAASADIAGLTPCSESKAYAKRLKNEVKGLNKRLKGVRAKWGRDWGGDLQPPLLVLVHRSGLLDADPGVYQP